jgi:FkbM family methyltransferase
MWFIVKRLSKYGVIIMRIEKDIFTILLDYMSIAGEEPRFLVIGAMDGVSYDCFTPYLRKQKWTGVFVEPVPEQFERLLINLENICGNNSHTFVNAAIADHDGYVKMLTIDQEAVDSGKVHPCFGGMSAIYPPRNGLSSAGDAHIVAEYGIVIEVKCITLDTLLHKYDVKSIDILCIDAEGWDYKILRQLNFGVWRPKLIRCEYINLSEEEKSGIVNILKENDYVYEISGMDINASPAELWEIISNGRDKIIPAKHTSKKLDNITFVTSIMNRDFDKIASKHDSIRGGAGFLEDLGDSGLNIFVYGDLIDIKVKMACDYNKGIHLMKRSLAELMSQPVSMRIMENINKRDTFQSEPIEKKEESVLNIYSFFLLNDATIYNPFNTEYFIFIDFWCLIENVKRIIENCRAEDVCIEDILGDARLFVSSIKPLNGLVSCFKDETEAWLGTDTSSLQHLSTCKIMGGFVPVINLMNGHYYNCLSQLLERDMVCSRESIMTVLTHSHNHLCTK